MSWIYLLFAGVLEIVWAYSMKQSAGFSKPAPTILTIATMIASFILLSLALRTLPLGTAYAVWTGIGILGAFVVGILFLAEPLTPARLIAATLILSGLVLMKVSSV